MSDTCKARSNKKAFSHLVNVVFVFRYKSHKINKINARYVCILPCGRSDSEQIKVSFYGTAVLFKWCTMATKKSLVKCKNGEYIYEYIVLSLGGQCVKKDSLFTLQISRELDSVSETAQWVHAVQHIWIQFGQGQNTSHTHSPGRRLLRTRLITTPPGTHTCNKSQEWFIFYLSSVMGPSMDSSCEAENVYLLIPGMFLDGL